MNMPIEQGVSIATAKHSFVEVQFENGSTVRLGELSRVDFVQMGIGLDGGYVNHLNLAVGFTTINVVPQRHDEYRSHCVWRQPPAPWQDRIPSGFDR